MALTYDIIPHTLQFKFEAQTSKGILTQHQVYYILVYDNENPEIKGIGEAAPFPDISIDYIDNFKDYLTDLCKQFFQKIQQNIPENIGKTIEEQIPADYPSIRFGLETALTDLKNGGQRKLYNSYSSIPINGLIWIGPMEFMQGQIMQKMGEGFSTLKMKIGALKFSEERNLLNWIRQSFGDDVELRLDANGAISPENAMEQLEAFNNYSIHSIEQPIAAGQPDKMKEVISNSPIPIALDEDLIGINDPFTFLEDVKPTFIILKPTMLGGIYQTQKWIDAANKLNIGWWITSALESNIGLNAIAQFTSSLQPEISQGLGTGQLYHNNIPCPWYIEKGMLKYNNEGKWDLTQILK